MIGWGALRAVEGKEDALLLTPRNPGTLVHDQHPNSVPHRAGAHRNGLPVAIARCILEHVYECPLELARVATQEGHVSLNRQLEHAGVVSDLLNGLLQHLVDR